MRADSVDDFWDLTPKCPRKTVMSIHSSRPYHHSFISHHITLIHVDPVNTVDVASACDLGMVSVLEISRSPTLKSFTITTPRVHVHILLYSITLLPINVFFFFLLNHKVFLLLRIGSTCTCSILNLQTYAILVSILGEILNNNFPKCQVSPNVRLKVCPVCPALK